MNSAQKQVLIACMLVTFAFGSIHAFSVFLPPLEESLVLARAKLSLIYSFSLIALTIMVLFGYRIYAVVQPNLMILISAICAALGLFWSANATSWLELVISYSVIFGATNGIAYGYSLQLVGRALPRGKKAFGMALVTATYAVGSVVFSFGLGYLVDNFSASLALKSLGLSVLMVGIIASVLLKRSQIQYTPISTKSGKTPVNDSIVSFKVVAMLWCSYCTAVFAGLMAIGHATGVIQSLGGNYNLGVWGAVFIGIGSSIGGGVISFLLSNKNTNRFLIGLPLVSAVFLCALVFVDVPLWAVGLLSFVGLAYGALIAVYPFAIAEYFGETLGPKVYGQVFTAWGFAGLAGPWLAGKLYDLTGAYQFALATAGGIAIISMVTFYGFLQYKAKYPLHLTRLAKV